MLIYKAFALLLGTCIHCGAFSPIDYIQKPGFYDDYNPINDKSTIKTEPKAPCHGSNSINSMNSNSMNSMNTMNTMNSMNSMFSNDASIDISFDSIMFELLSDVLYLELSQQQQQKQQKQQQQMQQMQQKQQKQQGGQRGSMILLLNNPKKVSSDTYRFNIESDHTQSNKNQKQQSIQSVSSPIQYFHETEIVYLCKKKTCRETERFEMTTISSNYHPQTGKFRAHLVATTTAAPIENENENESEQNENEEIENMNEELNDVGTFELGDSTSSDNEFDPSDDLILIEITVIIVIIIICGVGYALFRCVVDRRDNQRELKALMAQRGLALLENDMKNGDIENKGTKSRGSGGAGGANITTLNETFDNGNFTTDYQLGSV